MPETSRPTRRIQRGMSSALPDRHTVSRERAANRLRAGTNLHADLYKRQPAEVEVGGFLDAG